MEQEPKTPSEILNEGTRARIELESIKLEEHLARSSKMENVMMLRNRIELLYRIYHDLAADLPTRPELKEEMDAISRQLLELSSQLRNENVTEEELKAFIEKGQKIKRKIALLADELYPMHPENN